MQPKPDEAGLKHEILGEQAATIGQLAGDLRATLDALASHDQRVNSGKTLARDRRPGQRARLVDAAAYALWNFVVQRDCAGFRFTERALEEFAVPAEVRLKMGTVRSR